MLSFSSTRRLLTLLLFACVLGGAAHAQTKPTRTDLGRDTARSLLWVGNSFFYYNNSMHGHVANLSKAADLKPGIRGVSVAISASGLDWHDMASYFRPDGIGRYSFSADNEIMMDCSQCPVHPKLAQTFHDTVAAHSKTVRQHGAQPVLFMSWAYKDKPEMTEQLAEQYTRAGNANDALVIPVGLAFAKALAQRPDIELYIADKRHPTLAGTYLAACVVFASVTGQSPVANSYTAGLDAAAVAHLQNMAWQTVQAYYGTNSGTNSK
jgi:hypothetical protein